MNSPTEDHFHLVKRILRYVQGTLHYGLCHDIGLEPKNTTNSVVDRRVVMSPAQSKKQGFVSRSSTEAEYCALAHASAEVVWIHQILADLHVFLLEPPLLFCDNLSTLTLNSNPV